MPSIRLSTVMVYSSHNYRIQLSGRVTVGDIARYLTQYEAHVDASTMEIVRPVHHPQQLQEVDVQPGDRLLLFLAPTRQVELPAPLKQGDKVLKFSVGDFEISSRGKLRVMIGKLDEARQMVPDVDLRYFVSPESLDYISRECMWLEYDARQKVWYATRQGKTRIMIDEFELGTDKVSLNDDQWVRFYRATDNPRERANRAIGELRLIVEEVMSRDDYVHFEPGNDRINIYVGSEKDDQTLNVSDHLPVGQIVSSLTHYKGVPTSDNVRSYLTRLVPPSVRVQSLNLSDDEFFYTAGKLRYTQNSLLLHDIHNRDRIYVMSAGIEDDEKVIGCRSQSDIMEPTLDVDFFDALILRGHDQRSYQNIAGYLGRVYFRASENTWWIRLDEQAKVPMFINNARLNSNTLNQLMSGDVLSLGPSVAHYFARLEVEIATRVGG